MISLAHELFMSEHYPVTLNIEHNAVSMNSGSAVGISFLVQWSQSDAVTFTS